MNGDDARGVARRARDDACYSSVFMAAPDGILLANDDGRWVDVNPAAAEICGTPRDDLIGGQVGSLAVTDEQPRWTRFRAEGHQSGHAAIERPDGDVRIVAYRAVANIRPGLHLAVVHDVTHQGWGDAILRAHPDQIWILSRDGTIRAYAGPDRVDGDAPSRLVGSRIDDVFVPRLAAVARTMVERSLVEGELQTQEVDSSQEAGERFELRAVPLSDDEALMLVRSVTDRWEAEARLRRHAELDAIVGRITHALVATDRARLPHTIVDALGQVATFVGADASALVLRSGDDALIRPYEWHYAPGPRPLEQQPAHPPGERRSTLSARLLEGTPVFVRIDDPDLDPSYAEILRAFGAVAGAIVPVQAEGDVRGWLTYYWRGPRRAPEFEAGIVPSLRVFGGALSVAHDRVRAERREAEVDLLLRTVFDAIGVSILVTGPEEMVTTANRAACELFGLSTDEPVPFRRVFQAMPLHEDLTPFTPDELPTLATLRDGRPRRDVLAGVPGVGGKLRWLRVSTRPLDRGPEGTLSVVTTFSDVTALHTLRAHLGERARMEALGRLAGRVAHDFNNLLTVMAGYTSLLLTDLDEESSLRSDVVEIDEAVARGAALVDQLLSFSRRKFAPSVTIDVNQVVEGMRALLQRTIPATCELELRLAADPATVRADQGQLEQAILNLVVNAGDAMPDGGRLVIETTRSERAPAGLEPAPGPSSAPYVALSVSDTGIGMDAGTRARVFEPFFTTKPPGKGTGLGLSTVYGTIARAGGHVAVYSEPGHGSTFRVYLPSVDGDPAPPKTAEPVMPVRGGRETILLVEDDEAVRTYASLVLRRLGYEVVTAGSGAAAERAARASEGHIDLLVTDVVLSDARGPDLAAALRATRPGLRIVLTSGYTDAVLELEADDRVTFLAKPFSADDLARVVRRVLEGSHGHV